MLNLVALAVFALLAAILVFAATRPDAFRVQRSTRIDAPPEKIFALVHDFHRWTAWSPYEHLDPGMKRTYDGAEKGVGAAYAWDGSGKVGAGRMEITDTSSPTGLTIRLEFKKPFEATNTARFTFEPDGHATNVTWAMDGSYNYPSKVVGLFLDMDGLIGKDFEAGLAKLKSVVEA